MRKRIHTRVAAWVVLGAMSCGAAAPVSFGQAGPDTVVPVPRKEAFWTQLHDKFLDRAKKGSVDLLFLGDSITQGWNDNRTWQRHYGPRHAANFGISGDRTQHVLWRIQNGELENLHPKVVVLMIGTNNAGGNSADQIAQGVTAIVDNLRKQLPTSKILLLAVFPRGPKPGTPVREKLNAVNQQIAKLDDGSNVHYLDIGNAFLQADGTLSKDVMPDYLHLSPKGYQIWADAIEPVLWSMLDEHK